MYSTDDNSFYSPRQGTEEETDHIQSTCSSTSIAHSETEAKKEGVEEGKQVHELPMLTSAAPVVEERSKIQQTQLVMELYKRIEQSEIRIEQLEKEKREDAVRLEQLEREKRIASERFTEERMRHEEEVKAITERHEEEAKAITERHEQGVKAMTEKHEQEKKALNDEMSKLRMTNVDTATTNASCLPNAILTMENESSSPPPSSSSFPSSFKGKGKGGVPPVPASMSNEEKSASHSAESVSPPSPSASHSTAAPSAEKESLPTTPSGASEGKGSGPPTPSGKGGSGSGSLVKGKGPPVPGSIVANAGGGKGPPVPDGANSGKGQGKGPPLPPGKGGSRGGPAIPSKGQSKGSKPAIKSSSNRFVNVKWQQTRVAKLGPCETDEYLKKMTPCPEVCKQADAELKLEDTMERDTIFTDKTDIELPECPESMRNVYFIKQAVVERKEEKKRLQQFLSDNSINSLQMVLMRLKNAGIAYSQRTAVPAIKNDVLQCILVNLKPEDCELIKKGIKSVDKLEDTRELISKHFDAHGVDKGLELLCGSISHLLFFEICTIPHLVERVEFLAMQAHFEDEIYVTENKIMQAADTLNVLDRYKNKLTIFLQLIKKIGNSINEGTNKEISRGFSLKCLNEILGAKSTKVANHSILHFALILMEQKGGFFVDDYDLKELELMGQARMFNVGESVKDKDSALKSISSAIQRLKSNKSANGDVKEKSLEGDGHLDSLESFHARHSKRISNLLTTHGNSLVRYRLWAAYLDDVNLYWPPEAEEKPGVKIDLFRQMHTLFASLRKYGKDISMNYKDLQASCRPPAPPPPKKEEKEAILKEGANAESTDDDDDDDNSTPAIQGLREVASRPARKNTDKPHKVELGRLPLKKAKSRGDLTRPVLQSERQQKEVVMPRPEQLNRSYSSKEELKAPGQCEMMGGSGSAGGTNEGPTMPTAKLNRTMANEDLGIHLIKKTTSRRDLNASPRASMERPKEVAPKPSCLTRTKSRKDLKEVVPTPRNEEKSKEEGFKDSKLSLHRTKSKEDVKAIDLNRTKSKEEIKAIDLNRTKSKEDLRASPFAVSARGKEIVPKLPLSKMKSKENLVGASSPSSSFVEGTAMTGASKEELLAAGSSLPRSKSKPRSQTKVIIRQSKPKSSKEDKDKKEGKLRTLKSSRSMTPTHSGKEGGGGGGGGEPTKASPSKSTSTSTSTSKKKASPQKKTLIKSSLPIQINESAATDGVGTPGRKEPRVVSEKSTVQAKKEPKMGMRRIQHRPRAPPSPAPQSPRPRSRSPQKTTLAVPQPRAVAPDSPTPGSRKIKETEIEFSYQSSIQTDAPDEQCISVGREMSINSMASTKSELAPPPMLFKPSSRILRDGDESNERMRITKGNAPVPPPSTQIESNGSSARVVETLYTNVDPSNGQNLMVSRSSSTTYNASKGTQRCINPPQGNSSSSSPQGTGPRVGMNSSAPSSSPGKDSSSIEVTTEIGKYETIPRPIGRRGGIDLWEHAKFIYHTNLERYPSLGAPGNRDADFDKRIRLGASPTNSNTNLNPRSRLSTPTKASGARACLSPAPPSRLSTPAVSAPSVAQLNEMRRNPRSHTITPEILKMYHAPVNPEFKVRKPDDVEIFDDSDEDEIHENEMCEGLGRTEDGRNSNLLQVPPPSASVRGRMERRRESGMSEASESID